MTQLHPIYQRELDEFEEFIKESKNYKRTGDFIVLDSYKASSFLLASLQRASLAVVEESVGERITNENCTCFKNPPCNTCENEEAMDVGYRDGRNNQRDQTLATARTITGINETK